MEVLEARYLLEPQAALLAAKRAGPEIIAAMGKVLAKQGEEIHKGGTGQKEDLEFHDLIAKASGNSVLCSVLRVIRTENQILSYLSLIRKKVGGKLHLDHQKILRAIREHDAVKAEEAMKQHIRFVIQDVETYLK